MSKEMNVKILCYLEFEGSQVDEITVRSFKNKDRKLLGQHQDNINEFLVMFVANCITAVNGNKLDNPERKRLLVKRMERGDINNLFYAIKKLTKNNPMITSNAICPHCRDQFTAQVDTDELERRENREPEMTFTLPCGFEKNGEIHADIVMGKPTGETLIQMGRIEDIFEAIQRGVVSCINRVGEITDFTSYDYDELEYEDVKAIEEAWVKNLGGASITTQFTCPKCRKQFQSEVSLADFFD